MQKLGTEKKCIIKEKIAQKFFVNNNKIKTKIVKNKD